MLRLLYVYYGTLFLAFFPPCQNTVLSLVNAETLAKKEKSLNAINETYNVCACQFFSPTLCYDMHKEFKLFFHLGKCVNVCIIVQVISAVKFVWPSPPDFACMKLISLNAIVDNDQSFKHCALLVYIIFYIAI